jgi:hypothetical protein
MALLERLTDETYNNFAYRVLCGYVMIDYGDALRQSAEGISKYVDPVWCPPKALKPYFDRLPFTLEFSKKALPQLYNICSKIGLTEDQFVELVSNTMKDIVGRQVLPGKRMFLASPDAARVLDAHFAVGLLCDSNFAKKVLDFGIRNSEIPIEIRKKDLVDWVVSTFTYDWFIKHNAHLALAAKRGGIMPHILHEDLFYRWIVIALPKIGSGEQDDPLLLAA